MKTLPLKTLDSLVSLVIVATLTSGCVTSALWKNTARREWKPNPPDQVVLITDTNHQRAMVAIFRQFATVGKISIFRTVGLRLGQPPCELALTPRAMAQLTNTCGEFQSVPLFLAGNVPEDASCSPAGYAVWNSMDTRLTVCLDGYAYGPYLLPTTITDQRTAMRVFGMPFTIGADAAICLGAIMLFCGPALGAGAGP